MNKEELQTAKAKLAGMNAASEDLRVTLETRDAEVAELTGRVEVRQADFDAQLGAMRTELRRLQDDQASLLRERALLLEKRKDVKREYGVLYERIGRAERALEAQAAKEKEAQAAKENKTA